MKKVLLAAFAAFLSIGVFSQTLLDENFSGSGIPDGWTKTSLNATGWRFGAPAALSSQYWTIPAHDGKCAASNDDALGQNGNSNNDRLITPSLDLSTLSVPALAFDAFFNGAYGSKGWVLISTNGGVTASTFMTLSASEGWQNIIVSLEDYADETDVKIIFRHSDNGEWATGLAIDNVSVYALEENAAFFERITTSSYPEMNNDLEVKGEFRNIGSTTITSANISWVAGSQTASAVIDGLEIAPWETYEFTHPDMVTVGSEIFTLEVTINTVNDAESASITNPTKSIDATPLLFFPVRKVFVEQATGTWCGFCPRGHVAMDFLDETYPNSIEVAVHNNDPLANSLYNSGMSSQVEGYPSGLVDRTYNDIDPDLFEAAYLLRAEVQAIASVGVETEYNNVTRELTATITARFARDDENAKFRINAILVEDNVTGSGNGWDQVNYYAGGGQGTMGGYQNLPNPVPAANMVYRHVGRKIYGGWGGTANSIPTNVVAGEEYSYTYTYTIPNNYDDNELSIVGLIIDQTTGQIVNAEESGSVVSARELTKLGFDFKLYPNPALSETNIALSIEQPGTVSYMVYDMTGKQVAAEYKGQLAQGEYIHTIDVSNLNSGLYFVTINIDGNQLTRKLAVN